MGKLNNIWAYLNRHKYLITIAIGLISVGIIDENSFRTYISNQMRINELNAEIEQYTEQYERDSIQLHALTATKKGVERVARERYFMKRSTEDIFIINE